MITTHGIVIKRYSFSIWWAVVAILVGMFLLGVIVRRLPAPGVTTRPITFAEVIEEGGQQEATVSPYAVVLKTWATLIGPGVQIRRTLSLFLMALALACVFKLTLDITRQNGMASWATIILPLVLAPVAFQVWTLMQSWLCLWVALCTLTLWRLVNAPKATRLLWIAYILSMVLLVTSYWPFSAIVIFHLVYALFAARKPATRFFVAGMLAVVGVALSLSINARSVSTGMGSLFALPRPLAAFTDTLVFQKVAIFGVMWGLAFAGLVVLVLDQRRKGWRTTLFVMLWLIIPVVLVFRPGEWMFIASAALSIPIAIGLVQSLSSVSLRARVASAMLALVLLLPFQAASENTLKMSREIGLRYIPGTPIVMNFLGSSSEGSDVAERALETSLLPLYYMIGDQQALAVQPSGQIDVLLVPQKWKLEGSGVWVIGPSSPNPGTVSVDTTGKETTFQQDFEAIRATLLQARPTRDPIYLFRSLALLDFNIEAGNTVAPGGTLVLNSWWSAIEAPPNNYELSVSLVDAAGIPVARRDDLVALSFTGTWEINSLHYDRRLIDIPSDLPPGNYNLVMSIRGTVGDTSNIAITLNNGAVIGEFGYLTTITVAK